MLLQTDARALPLADASVQCVVTSPPYWSLRDYGVAEQIGLEATPEDYVAHMVAVFREVRRVLRPDGVVWLNLADTYASGGEIGRHEARETPAVIGTTRKFLGTARQYATRDHGLKPKDLVGIPWRVAFALQADGWYLRADVIWAKPDPMPESVTDRPTKSHELLFLLAKSESYFYDKASSLRHRCSVWTIAKGHAPEAHCATFPEALVMPCVLAGSRIGDVVLDPFGGTGTVGAVAERLARRWVVADLKPDYLAHARRRTAQRGLPFPATMAAG